MKGIVDFDIDINDLVTSRKKVPVLSEKEIREDIHNNPMSVVAATVGEDEYSVGLKEILDIKHGGLKGSGSPTTISVPPVRSTSWSTRRSKRTPTRSAVDDHLAR